MPLDRETRARVERALRRWATLIYVVVLGAALAPVEALLLAGCALLAAPGLVWSGARDRTAPVIRAGTRRLVETELRRLAMLPGPAADEAGQWSADRHRVRFLATRCLVGLLGGVVVAFLAYGLVFGAAMVWSLVGGDPVSLVGDRDVTLETVLLSALPGVPLLFINLHGIAGVAAVEVTLARHYLGPDPQEVLQQRVTALATSRAAVVEAVTDERRRIERDLHDGVQQRLVALSMLLGRARRARTPDQAGTLLDQAHDEAQQALHDLRDVAWRIYPTALDSGGLEAALETVAERAAIPVEIDYAGPARWDLAAEAVVYFVVCEAVTNAAKHSGADRVTVRFSHRRSSVRVTVRDDGCGGADPGGTGLSGLARRVSALDGALTVVSPPGGPTTVTAELPCG